MQQSTRLITCAGEYPLNFEKVSAKVLNRSKYTDFSTKLKHKCLKLLLPKSQKFLSCLTEDTSTELMVEFYTELRLVQ